MDEDLLARLEPGQVDERVVGGEEHDRHGGRLLEGPAVRHGGDHPVIGDGHRPERLAEHAEDAVPGCELGYVGGDFGDDARSLDPHGARFSRVHVECVEYVAEVQARGAHTDPYLAGCQRFPEFRVGDQGEVGQGPAAGGVQAPDVGAGRRDQGSVVGEAGQARRPYRPVAYDDLRLVTGEDAWQFAYGLLGAVDVHQHEAAGFLGLGGADEAPDRGRRGVAEPFPQGLGVGRHRATGDQGEPGGCEPAVAQPLLDQ